MATTLSKENSGDELLLLEVFINGRSTDKIGEFTLRDGSLMSRPEELQDLGFRIPATRTFERGGLMSLSDLRGLTWTIDQKNQKLFVTASEGSLVPTELTVEGTPRPTDRRVIESSTGMTLNYDIAGTYASGQTGRHRVLRFARLLAARRDEFGLACLWRRKFAGRREKHGDSPRFSL